MKYRSIWKDNIDSISYKKLDKDIDCDVLIIGGGITGVSSLYNLRDSKLKVVLVEQNRIGYSTTGNSTGKLTYLQNDLLDKIRNNCDEKKEFSYLKFIVDGMNEMVNLIKDKNIDCNLTKVDSYLYTNKDDEIDKIKNLAKRLYKYGIKTNVVNNDFVESKLMISASDTYLINPIKFLYGLIKYNK